jgi:hypothetical protein
MLLDEEPGRPALLRHRGAGQPRGRTSGLRAVPRGTRPRSTLRFYYSSRRRAAGLRGVRRSRRRATREHCDGSSLALLRRSAPEGPTAPSGRPARRRDLARSIRRNATRTRPTPSAWSGSSSGLRGSGRRDGRCGGTDEVARSHRDHVATSVGYGRRLRRDAVRRTRGLGAAAKALAGRSGHSCAMNEALAA